MPKFAQIDPTVSAPSPVIGWYDTDALTYPTLPPSTNLLTLTQAQWDEHMTGLWAVSAGALVAYTPPAPVLTLAQQAQALLAAGLGIVSSGTPALSGTYAADPATVAYVNSEVTSILLNNTFADGSTTIEWPDTAGALHAMTIAQFKTVAAELGVFVSGIRKCVIGASGAALPAASVTIA